MNYSAYYALWGAMYLLCFGLGMIPEPAGVGYAACLVCGLLFFVPPMLLLQKARKEKSRKHLSLVRDLSFLSLGLTVLAFLVNVASAMGSELLGNLLHIVMGAVSVPMFCCQVWFLSLLGWAVLLSSARVYLQETR